MYILPHCPTFAECALGKQQLRGRDARLTSRPSVALADKMALQHHNICGNSSLNKAVQRQGLESSGRQHGHASQWVTCYRLGRQTEQGAALRLQLACCVAYSLTPCSSLVLTSHYNTNQAYRRITRWIFLLSIPRVAVNACAGSLHKVPSAGFVSARQEGCCAFCLCAEVQVVDTHAYHLQSNTNVAACITSCPLLFLV